MTDFTFGKNLRLLTSSDFQSVFNNALLKSSHSSFLILARPNQLPHSRLGLVIAKKNIRLAVNRNRVKRLIRESFRHQQHNLNGIDAIVLARRGMDQCENKALLRQLDQQWMRIVKKSKNLEQT